MTPAKPAEPRRARRSKVSRPPHRRTSDARATLVGWRARAASLLKRHPAGTALGAAALAAALSAGIARRV